MTEFAICMKCSNLFKYSAKIGTNSLYRHYIRCQTIKVVDKSETIDRHVIKPIKNINELKTKIADSIVVFAAKDLRPINVINGEGFRYLSQELLNIGSKNPNIKVEDVLPSDTCVSNHLNTVYSQIKEKLINELSIITVFGITCDHWSYDKLKTNYLTITVQYISNNKTFSRVLTTCPTPDKTSKSTQIELKKVFSDFKIDDKMKYYVTDNASAMLSAFSTEKHFGCSAHNINLVHKHSYEEMKNDENLRNIRLLFENSKELVSHFKHSDLQNKLKTTLKQSIDIRWDSKYVMLESIKNNYLTIKTLSINNEKIMKCLIYINEEILNDLLLFLKPFYELRMTLCQDKNPTFHLVLPTKEKMLLICDIIETDSDYMRRIKAIYSKNIKKYFKVSDLHIIGSMIFPPIKSLNNLVNSEQKTKSINLFKSMVNNQTIQLTTTIRKSKPEKKSFEFCLQDFIDSNETDSEDMTNEVEVYLKTNFNLLSDFSVIKFWEENKGKYPRIYLLAKQLLSIPATNLSSEKNFSIAGLTLCDNRSRTNPYNVDKLLFIHSNYDLYNQ